MFQVSKVLWSSIVSYRYYQIGIDTFAITNKKAKKSNENKTCTEPKIKKSYWTLTFSSDLETDSTDTDADMHSLSSSDHCNDDVDSLENERRPILPEIEATRKEDNFVLVKFESTTQGASSSRIAAPIYYTGHILAVHGKEYEIKFLRRTMGELFMYPKIDDIVHIYEKNMEMILYVDKRAKTMAHQSSIVRFFCLSKLHISLINHQITLIYHTLTDILIFLAMFHINPSSPHSKKLHKPHTGIILTAGRIFMILIASGLKIRN